MDKCLFDEKVIYAFEVAEDFNKESDIRKQSGLRTLLCSDTDCNQPVIYRRGEIKRAHFAHLKSDKCCPYDSYYRGTPEGFQALKISIFKHFTNMNYNIEIDVKVIPKHYTPILCNLVGGQKHAIEFAHKNISANKLDELKKLYNDADISVEWIIVDSMDNISKEKDAYYIKRFQLNISEKRTAIIYDNETSEFEAISFDKVEYQYTGETYSSQNNIFRLKFDIDNLIIADGCLTAAGFKAKFNEWIDVRKANHERKIRELEEHNKCWGMIERKRQAEKKESFKREQEIRNSYSVTPINTSVKKDESFNLASITIRRTQQQIGAKLFCRWDERLFLDTLALAASDDVSAIKRLIGKLFEAEDDELAIFLALYHDAQSKEPTLETQKYIEVCEHILKQTNKIMILNK